MLTGGQTAERLYTYWSEKNTLPWSKVHFLFGDERCVSPEHSESNYALVMKTLFSSGLPAGCQVTRMHAESSDKETAAKEYGDRIPGMLDVLLLGLGQDGHIASLFPHNTALENNETDVLPVEGPTSPHERLTITPGVISRADSVFLLATGEKKGRILGKALKSPEDFIALPVCLTMQGTWLLDDAAQQQL